jgi:hypothetical protein
MTRWSGPQGWGKVAAYHRRREAAALAVGDDDLAAEAARIAAHFEGLLDSRSRCRRCGRALTDPTSVARGIGPECWAREAPATTPERLEATAGPTIAEDGS